MYIFRGYQTGYGAGPSRVQKAKSKGWQPWLSKNLNLYRRTFAWGFSSVTSKGRVRSTTIGFWDIQRMKMGS